MTQARIVLAKHEMVTFATVAEVHRAMSPMAEGGGSPAAATHRTTRLKSFKKKKSREDTVINLEEITEAPNTEPGYDDGGANNNVERRSGNEQDQGEITPG